MNIRKIRNLGGMILFFIIIITLIFLGTDKKIDLPLWLDKILDNFMVKILLLIILIFISRYSLQMGILVAVIYILIAQRIVDNELEKKTVDNIVDANKEPEKNKEAEEKYSNM